MKTIQTPYIRFKPHSITVARSEQVACDNPLAQPVAKPLFDAGIRIAAITHRINYRPASLNQRTYHTFVLLLQGKIILERENVTDVLEPGTLAYIAPDTACWRHTPGKTWWLYVTANDTKRWEPLKKRGAYVRHYESADLMFLHLRAILDAHASREPSTMARAIGSANALLELLDYEVRRAAQREEHSQVDELHKLVAQIHASPHLDWTRARMAQQLNLSASQFARIFKDVYDLSPLELIIQQRLNLAVSMLIYTDEKVERIANKVGYTNLFSFIRLFKKQIGVSPGVYRQRHRSTH